MDDRYLREVTGGGPRDQLIALGREVGESRFDLAIAGEGNLSGPCGPGAITVTASGARLGELDDTKLVDVRIDELSRALDDPKSDSEWLEAILASRIRQADPRPTVEVALHAVIAAHMGSVWIVHAHPVDVLAIACSEDLPAFAQTRLFPDHVVALGSADLWLPYVDPGQSLAIAVRDGMIEHERQNGANPVSMILGNHGAFVVGSTPRESFDRMQMLAKAARVFRGGGRRGMPGAHIERIQRREDEAYRRVALRNNT